MARRRDKNGRFAPEVLLVSGRFGEGGADSVSSHNSVRSLSCVQHERLRTPPQPASQPPPFQRTPRATSVVLDLRRNDAERGVRIWLSPELSLDDWRRGERGIVTRRCSVIALNLARIRALHSVWAQKQPAQFEALVNLLAMARLCHCAGGAPAE